MFTRNRWNIPQFGEDWKRGLDDLRRSLYDYFLSLETPGALNITETSIDTSPIGASDPSTGAFTTLSATGLITATGGQIKFPATQAASTDANTLDDYEESSTTPTVTAQSGTFTTVSALVKATKIGQRVCFSASVSITTNNTAAGYVIVPLPYTPANVTGCGGIESQATGVGLAVIINTDGNLRIYKYDGTYPGADGRTLLVSGSYIV